MEYLTIAQLGNAVDFGDLSSVRQGNTGCANSTRGVSVGGYEAPARLNTIEFVTISTLGNTADFGDLKTGTTNNGSCSNSIRGVSGGGGAPGDTNAITCLLYTSDAADE